MGHITEAHSTSVAALSVEIAPEDSAIPSYHHQTRERTAAGTRGNFEIIPPPYIDTISPAWQGIDATSWPSRNKLYLSMYVSEQEHNSSARLPKVRQRATAVCCPRVHLPLFRCFSLSLFSNEVDAFAYIFMFAFLSRFYCLSTASSRSLPFELYIYELCT